MIEKYCKDKTETYFFFITSVAFCNLFFFEVPYVNKNNPADTFLNKIIERKTILKVSY